MRFIKHHKLLLIFFLGLIIRLLLMFTYSSFDINNHLSWSQDLYHRGFPGFYETQSKEVYGTLIPNYPPLSVLIFYLIYLIKEPLFSLLWFINLKLPIFPSKIMFFLSTREYFIGLFKLPAIIFDLLLAYLLYRITKKLWIKSNNKPIMASIFILFNPIFIYASSLWGQIESFVLFFFLLSLDYLINRKNLLISSILFTLSIVVKPVDFIFLPIYGLYIIKNYSMKKIILSLLSSLGLFYIIYLPFYKTGSIITYPLVSFYQRVMTSLSISYVTNSAFNFWGMFPSLIGVKESQLLFNIISYQYLGLIMVGLICLSIVFKYLKESINNSQLFYLLFLTGYTMIMFLTKMHERYFIHLLPLALLTFFYSKKFKPWLIYITIFSFINLYYSWSVPYLTIFDQLKNPLTIMVFSILNFIAYCFLLFKYFFI